MGKQNFHSRGHSLKKNDTNEKVDKGVARINANLKCIKYGFGGIIILSIITVVEAFILDNEIKKSKNK